MFLMKDIDYKKLWYYNLFKYLEKTHKSFTHKSLQGKKCPLVNLTKPRAKTYRITSSKLHMIQKIALCL